mgnify:CR=1 FL=1
MFFGFFWLNGTMTTVTFDFSVQQTHFGSAKDLYEYLIDNQLVTEVGFVEEKELSAESKSQLEEVRAMNDDDFVNL